MTVACQAPLSMGFSRQEYWSGLPYFPPGIKPRPPAVQADTSLYELPGKSKNSGLGSLSLLQRIFPTRNGTGVSYIADGFFTRWATREAQSDYTVKYYQPGDQISPLNLHIPFKFISIPPDLYFMK